MRRWSSLRKHGISNLIPPKPLRGATASARVGNACWFQTRDLGGHPQFSGRHTNYTLTQRLDKLQGIWPRLRASFSPLQKKLASLPVAAWPKGLHGVSAVSLGAQHFARLRSGAMLGLSWDRPGASPSSCLSLMLHPIMDPEFYAVRQTVGPAFTGG